jgi:hypothetical protein
MEVAKLILNVVKNKSHMTLSVKPFGCMPSSGVSDGVQSVITERYPEAIFCAVETSGEGAVNFHSRVQLFLFKARQRAQQELQAALDQYGITREQAQAFVAKSRYGHALYRAPHYACGSAADLIHEIGPLVGRSALARRRIELQRALQRLGEFASQAVRGTAASLSELGPYLPAVAFWAAKEGGDAFKGHKARWRSLVEEKIMPTAEQLAELARTQTPGRVVQLRKRGRTSAEPAGLSSAAP